MLKTNLVAAALLAMAGTAMAQPLSEDFDDVAGLPGSGWSLINNSAPLGPNLWFQGNIVVNPGQPFPGQTTDGYAAANWASTTVTGVGDISNWMITPVRTLANGDTIKFWTRTVDLPAFPDRMAVRMSLAGPSANVGSTATSVGDFTTELLVINANLTLTDYPTVWTEYTIVLSGIPAPTQGRLAFWYNVPQGGAAGANSDFIGVDTFTYEPATASCYPDCNGDGVLNLSDFGCFTTKFALGDAYADCNGDGIRNLADFGCFTTKFALGCP
ncbi:MAG: choice-of-anchor J domain-containing protein [Phycisphaerales bacterium]|nr:choice-of-anchor J domain-containing protein [Phycisphaerales bacterium]